MPPAFRSLILAALGALAFSGAGWAADDGLPPESSEGEWLADMLDDGSLWFSSSENLGFEAIARELADYPRGRRWVRVVDGKPAWVMYYVPGEILGFEVDTHHYGAAATDFHFAAGATWNALTAIDTDYEEIVAFEAKWLRLYRAADELPPGTRFLKIEFPSDAEADAARLTEVWLRCRFDDAAAPVSAPASPGVATSTTSAAAVSVPVADELAVEPLVVSAFVYRPWPLAEPVFPSVTFDAAWPVEPPDLAAFSASYDVIGDLMPAVAAPPAPPPAKPENLFSRLAALFRHHGNP